MGALRSCCGLRSLLETKEEESAKQQDGEQEEGKGAVLLGLLLPCGACTWVGRGGMGGKVPGEAWKDKKVKEKKELQLMLPQRRRNSLVLAFHLGSSRPICLPCPPLITPSPVPAAIPGAIVPQ